MMFTHLQVQTGYSLLSSTVSIGKLTAKAEELGYRALAITDRNVMYGAVPFYKACKQAGIKPIIGLTADVESGLTEGKSFPLVLLAKNNTGYHHLLKISSAIQTRAKEGIPLKWLKGYSSGVFAFTPGIEGEVEQLLMKDPEQAAKAALLLQEQFEPGHFFLSVGRCGQQGEEAAIEAMKKLSASLSVPLLVSNRVTYINKEEAFAAQCLEAIRDGVKLADKHIDENDQAYFTSKEEMAELFVDLPEALEQTARLADACQVDIPLGRRLLPRYPVPDGGSAALYLHELCQKGLEESERAQQPEYEDRLAYELDTIERMGFSDYFLIVWDFMKFAKDENILTGPGRGSAAGSLVAYVLGITTVDPLEHGLLFERFLNPERVSMPDIDLDFPDHRRDEVIRYVANKYGMLHAAQIITFGTLSAKAVMRDVARVFGFSTKELEQLSKLISSRSGLTLKQQYAESAGFREWVHQTRENEKIYKTALTLEGLPRHTSTHAAGMVITEEPLTELVAIQEGHDGIFLTQFPMDTLEELGLLKIDLLGLRNLTILERMIDSIYYVEGKRLTLQNIPLQNEETFRLLGEGKTTGIFQLESEGMRKVLTKLKPNRFEDIVAVNALYRPGPMENIPLYIERKHGRQPVDYPHPDLKDILEPTYGVLIYQEQIMQIASKLAGFSLGEADLLRRAVSKKKKGLLDSERRHFVEGAVKNGYSEETAESVYHLIVQFANYGFNRSHAVAYSFIAYGLAYLKAHYPAIFMAALLSSAVGNEDKIKQYAAEVKDMGLALLPPSINRSHYPFKAEDAGIRFSLAAIKGVGAGVLKAVTAAREKGPFIDLFDFCMRVPLNVVNRKAMEAFVFAGAFDDFKEDRAVLLATLDAAIEHAQLIQPEEGADGALFVEDDFFPKPKYTQVDPIRMEDKLTLEKEVLGLYLSAHPTEPYEKLFKQAGAVPISRLTSGSRSVSVGIFMNEVKSIRTKKGENMAFADCSDRSGDIEGVVFPAVYRTRTAVIQKGAVLYLTGDVEERNGRKQLIVKTVKSVEELQEWQLEKEKTLYLKIPESPDEHLILEDVHRLLGRFKGETSVVLHYERSRQTVKLREKSSVKPTEQLLEELKKIIGTEHVVLK
ncbi:DNA polymerase III subunit alpha [Bacillus aerolatus]|uniref:DNA polymerase III subunit alpha n=1 Tax=Bacillus aerolatus TaxID=2653354 RepID=A0A6I1FIE3_9BACI|nr:DNA polymerase III subunit alpha [Bacillus aerolatus]KAB7706023.1 DNA polymerase III subunit alpha [Bacillus aerolatus]